MYRLAIAICSSLILAGCVTDPKPATVEGECRLMRDPGFPVRGERPKDQRWINRTQETGIQNCGWPRPAPEPDEPTVADVPAA